MVGSAGLITFLLGAFVAIFQQDLKGLLAYSTISHLGLITLLLGLDSPLGQVAAIFHIMNHATFKASLFMAAGIIDHETGTRDMRRLSGLCRFMPITATLAMVAAAAMAGVPLLNGFLSKEMFFAETIEIHDNSLVDQALPYIVTLASMFTVAYSLRFIRDVFFGPAPADLPRTPHEPPFLMRLPIELLVLACLVVGIAPAVTVGPVLDAAVRAVLGAATPAIQPRRLAWLHPRAPDERRRARRGRRRVLHAALLPAQRRRGSALAAPPQGPAHLRAGARHPVVAAGQTAGEPARHPASAAAAAAAGSALHSSPRWRRFTHAVLPSGGSPSGDLDLAFALVWAVGIACALGAAYQAKFHRLAALILLGGAGLVTCITFVWLSAPDLALTQLVVETVTTVLLLLGLRWLPKRIEQPAARGRLASMMRWHRVRDFAIAACAGAGLAIARLCGDDAAGARQHLALLRGERLRRGRRHQRRQRHPGRFPRLRHAWRDHGARRRRADRLRAAAPLPPGAREHRSPRAAARPGHL